MSEINSLLHHRRSIRLPGYDYSQAGEYFITICSYGHECIFGEVSAGEMQINPVGEIVREEWLRTPQIRTEIELGEFVIMPNHFHAIVHILDKDAGERVCGTDDRSNIGLQPKTIGALVAGFKSSVTIQINALHKTPYAPIWQRNYYEHIIESEKEYLAIEAYIENNPANWVKDQLWIDLPHG